MDPITTAIMAALANLSKDAVKDCYDCLKGKLKKKFGETSDLVEAVDKLEKKPDSEARKAMLQEEIETAKVNDDPELLELAQELIEKIKEQPGGQNTINQTQNNTVSDVKVGGNFEFKPVQKSGS